METANLVSQSYPLIATLYMLFIVIVTLVFYTFSKLQALKNLRQENAYFRNELNDLENQAKLIVQNDMELKIYQDEIEDKLKKLSLLHNLIGSSINILDRKELFGKLDEELINNLGFKKALLFIPQANQVELNINFLPEEVEIIKEMLREKATLLNAFSVVTDNIVEKDPKIARILAPLRFKHFLFAPITVGSQVHALFILAKCILPAGITEAEKELFSIICMYLSQCLDNIKLFEALYHAGEELESKVKEKTFELKKSLNEIREMSNLKSTFISGVSHELRTPLTSIKGFSSLLVAEKFGKLPPEAKERLKKIDTNVDRLVNMVNTLLDISRIESKKVEIKIAPSDIAKLIKDTGEFLMPQISEKRLHFETDIPPVLITYIDTNLMERVFINIINNAIKFTPEGGTITVKAAPYGDSIIISVKDTGYGMSKTDCEKIFGEFYRADNPINQKVRGTGLGLSLVKQIIETHNQKIWVESEMGKGTTFYFTLRPAQ